ncbi:MAG: tyrosine-type recombinase/integrase [Bacteroidetes bacterium]|nr:tyrosine-type recombinase/integrase [Bacteroidota bacterium]
MLSSPYSVLKQSGLPSDTFVFESRRRRVGDNAGVNPEYVSRRFRHFARLAKMPDGTTFHTLRYTYISWMAMEGIPIPVVREFAGHADIRTTIRYSHLGPDSLSDQVFARRDSLAEGLRVWSIRWFAGP